MNNKIKIGIIVILIVLVILLLLNMQGRSITATSNKKTLGTKLTQTTENINKIKVDASEVINPVKTNDSTSKYSNIEYSYLELYEKTILASDCNFVFKSKDELMFNKNNDPYHYFKQNVQTHSLRRQTELVTVQIHKISDLLTLCKDLEKEVNALIKENNYINKFKWSNPIKNYSFKRFSEAIAITDEELAIDSVIKKLQVVSKISMNYGSYVNGKSTLTKNERKQINLEIQELTQLMYTQTRPIETGSFEELQEERKKLKQAIEQKQQYLKSALYIDEKRLQYYRDGYAKFYPRVLKLLNTKYAYVFMKVYRPLSRPSKSHGQKPSGYETNMQFMQKFHPQHKTIADIVFQNTGFKYRTYFDHIITPATNLYLCYLGMDCSTSSRIVRNYCLGLNNFPVFIEACSTDLETFYYETYLSNNQIADTNKIFEYMVSEYAK